MAFGQGSTAITPIALANAYATFANGGKRYEPEVAAAIINAHNHVVVRYQPRILGHVDLPASVRDPILQGLEGVVENPRGTAYGTFHSIVSKPKYVVLCVIAQGGYGADAAAPVVAEAFNYLVAHPIKPISLKPNLSVPVAKKAVKTTKKSG
jgi:penicillin-binding protein 2